MANWDERAERWSRRQAERGEVYGPATEMMLDLTDLRNGNRVLDVAAGAGDQTVMVARRVGPTGYLYRHAEQRRGGGAKRLAPAAKARKGFKALSILADDTAGEYGILGVFETKEDADATFEALFPNLQQASAGIVQGQPTRRLFEVLEPKA